MRYERDDSLTRAAVIIRDRIHGLPEFARARSEVIESALARIREHGGASVPTLRALGGLTQIAVDAVDALPAKYRLNYGSRMWPRSVRDELRAFHPELRCELQGILAKEHRAQAGDPEARCDGDHRLIEYAVQVQRARAHYSAQVRDLLLESEIDRAADDADEPAAACTAESSDELCECHACWMADFAARQRSIDQRDRDAAMAEDEYEAWLEREREST